MSAGAYRLFSGPATSARSAAAVYGSLSPPVRALVRGEKRAVRAVGGQESADVFAARLLANAGVTDAEVRRALRGDVPGIRRRRPCRGSALQTAIDQARITPLSGEVVLVRRSELNNGDVHLALSVVRGAYAGRRLTFKAARGGVRATGALLAVGITASSSRSRTSSLLALQARHLPVQFHERKGRLHIVRFDAALWAVEAALRGVVS